MLKKQETYSIERMALEQRRMKGLGEVGPLGNKVFDILEYKYNVLLFIYPIESDNVCGFTYKKDDKVHVFVNSNMSRGLQNFVCAHELYHVIQNKSMYSDNLIVCDTNDISEELSEKDIESEERKANYFAASFLLPVDVIKERFNGFNSKYQNEAELMMEIIKLQRMYEVPYKMIIKRLYEAGIIAEDIFKKLITLEERVLEMCSLLDNEVCEDLKCLRESDKRKYNSLNAVKTAVEVYSKFGLSFSRLEQILEKYDKTPFEFDIVNKTIDPLDIDLGSFGIADKEKEDEN
ncbi:MAG: ImmA/IrrE family metallo-endopeptidase [Clostridia bacterium]|nr:ImmA/IrrE family metallo-endopeptidase [Clostridia bacterium]